MEKEYLVSIQEVHNCWVKVKANSIEEAKVKAEEGDYDDTLSLDYNYSLDKRNWVVNERI